jgi:hypothetical protein
MFTVTFKGPATKILRRGGFSPVLIAAIVVCFVSVGVLNVLHFRMKFRLMAAGLPVKWFMMPWDDFRMWRTYVSEAPTRRWPLWPFCAYRVFMVVFAISGVVILLNADKLDGLFRLLRPDS